MGSAPGLDRDPWIEEATPWAGISQEGARVLIDAREGRVARSAVVQQLVKLGPKALPELFQLLVDGSLGVASGPASGALLDVERRDLLEALDALPETQLRALLTRRLEQNPGLQEQLVALKVLGHAGSRRAVNDLFQWASWGSGQSRVPRSVRAEFEQALTSSLRRDSLGLREISRAYVNAPAGLLLPVLQAVGSEASEERLDLLLDLGTAVPQAEALAIAEVGQVAARLRVPPNPRTQEEVVQILARAQGSLLSGSILAAQRMDCLSAVPTLIDHLGNADEGVRELAHGALQHLTGAKVPKRKDDWARWLQDQRQWWRDEAPNQLFLVASGSDGQASRALLALAKRRYFRHELSGPLAAALSRDTDSVAVLTCATLGYLGSLNSIGPLLKRLEDGSSDVRRAAFLALCSLTGEDHGDKVQAWRSAGW